MRIACLAVANGFGDKLHVFVIAKTKKPRCFKNVKFLLCRYRNQRKRWIDGVFFEECVREGYTEERKVALVIALLILMLST